VYEHSFTLILWMSVSRTLNVLSKSNRRNLPVAKLLLTTVASPNYGSVPSCLLFGKILLMKCHTRQKLVIEE